MSAPSQRSPRGTRAIATRKALIVALVLGGVSLGVLYVLVPNLAGLDETWKRLAQGDPWWLGVAAILELASFAGYMLLFHTVFGSEDERIGWRLSYQATMAGLAATRLFSTAGVGGILLTVWILRRASMSAGAVTRRMTAFFVLLYGVFMLALVLGGLGLHFGVFPGPAPYALTVLPAVFGASVIAVVLALSLLPSQSERGLTALGRRSRVTARWAAAGVAASAAVAAGIRTAIDLIRRGLPGLLGAPAWWAFDIAVLWASFHAFGEPPPAAVLVLAYFIGMLANLLPLPGGIGGVEGAMVGALIGFGVPGGLALVAVLTYRAFAFWLPMIPGAIAYMQLRGTVHGWDAEPEV